MRKGFTLVELFVAILIVGIVLGAVYFTYITILKGFWKESSLAESQIETAVGIELIRLDIEHAGYGIGIDQVDLPVELDRTNNSLIIRSVLNNTRLIRDSSGQPVQWSLVECSGAGGAPSVKAGGDVNAISGGAGLVFLGASSKTFMGQTTDGSCPSTGIFVAIPYDTSVTSGCGVQFCNRIKYTLSSNQDLTTCNPNTRNLLRAVGSGSGMPLINCVSDVRYTFDVDRDGDGAVDVRDGAFMDAASSLDLDLDNDGSVSAEELRRGLKAVNVYLLVQEGRLDREFKFTNHSSCSKPPTDIRLSNRCVVTDTGVELYLPQNFNNYRWKVIKLTVKPMNL